MIFFGKWSIDGAARFVHYLDPDQPPYEFVALADGTIRPLEIGSVYDISRAATRGARVVCHARPARVPLYPIPLPEPEKGDDDFTPLGAHVLDLTQSDFSGMRFGKADFRGAAIAGAKFTKTRLAESRFDPYYGLANVDCTGADLSGGRFSKLLLYSTNFTGANLAGAAFEDCTGLRTNFNGAALEGARIKADLTEATFTGAAGAADFAGSTLTRCDFTGARLAGATFSGATLDGGRFAGASLAGAKFGGENPAVFTNNVDLGGADLQRADLSKTSLRIGQVKANRPTFGTTADTRTRLAGADIDTAFLGNDWSYLDCEGATLMFARGFGKSFKANFAILTGCNFSGRKLAGAEFRSAMLQGASFGNCDLEDAQFNQAVLGSSSSGVTSADFTGARLCLADFEDADLTGVTFASTNLQGARFTNALLQQTSFANAYAPQVDFAKIRDRRMQGVSFDGACLVSAKFLETTLSASGRPPSFAGALLMGTVFRGASLADAILTNAKLSTAAGKIKVILKSLPGQGAEEDVLSYEATELDPSITGMATRCPNGSPGPCNRKSLTTDVPAEWNQP